MHSEEITITDIEILKELQPDGWPDILPHFRFYINSAFCKPIKLVEGHSIVGIGTTILHHSTAWLAHIIVHRDHSNKGIGTKVTRALLDSLNNTKYSTVSLIATVLGEPVYRKFGFEKVTEYHFFKCEDRTSFDTERNNIKKNQPSFSEDIFKLDRMMSAENRISLLESHLPEAEVYLDGNKPSGFYMPTLNEGLIVAKDPSVGIELLKHRLKTKPFSVVPQENESVISFLEANNFKHFQTGARMSLGSKIDFKGQMLFSRIGGNLG